VAGARCGRWRLAAARRRAGARLWAGLARPFRGRAQPAGDIRASGVVAGQRFSHAGPVPERPAGRRAPAPQHGEAMMGTVPLIEESAASAEIRAVFDDIKRTRNVDWINNFWKALANHPPTLRRTWESVKEVMAPGALDPLTKELIYLAVSISNG